MRAAGPGPHASPARRGSARPPSGPGYATFEVRCTPGRFSRYLGDSEPLAVELECAASGESRGVALVPLAALEAGRAVEGAFPVVREGAPPPSVGRNGATSARREVVGRLEVRLDLFYHKNVVSSFEFNEHLALTDVALPLYPNPREVATAGEPLPDAPLPGPREEHEISCLTDVTDGMPEPRSPLRWDGLGGDAGAPPGARPPRPAARALQPPPAILPLVGGDPLASLIERAERLRDAMAAASAEPTPLESLVRGGLVPGSGFPGASAPPPAAAEAAAAGGGDDVLGRILGLSEPTHEAEEMAAYLQHAFVAGGQVGPSLANPFLLEDDGDGDTRSELSDGTNPGAVIEDALLEELLHSSERDGGADEGGGSSRQLPERRGCKTRREEGDASDEGLHRSEGAGAEGLFEVRLRSVVFLGSETPPAPGSAYAVVRCPLSRSAGVKIWLPGRALRGGARERQVSTYLPVPPGFFEAAGGVARGLVVELWAEEGVGPPHLVGLARVPLPSPSGSKEGGAIGAGVLTEGTFDVYNPIEGNSAGRLEVHVAVGLHEEDSQMPAEEREGQVPAEEMGGQEPAEEAAGEAQDPVPTADADPGPASGHLSPSEGGVAPRSSEAGGTAQAGGAAASEAMTAAEGSSGDSPEIMETMVQHTFEVTIVTVGDRGAGGLRAHSSDSIGRYICYSFPEEEGELCTEVVAAEAPVAEFHASVCHTLHLDPGADPTAACQAGGKALRFELWEKAPGPATQDLFVAVAELPLADVLGLIGAPEAQRDFELEAEAPVGPSAPLQGRPFVRVAVRHWGGGFDDGVREGGGGEAGLGGRTLPMEAAAVPETASPAIEGDDEGEENKEGHVEEDGDGGEPAPLAETSEEEEAGGGGQDTPSGGGPCRLHVHVRQACGLWTALEEAELAGVRKDGSSALTEAVECGPNPFAEFDLGLPGCATVRTHFDVETCEPSFNFHADLEFDLDDAALAHLASGDCRVALLHRAPGGGGPPEGWSLCAADVPLFPLLTAPGGLSGWFTLLTP